MSFPTKIDLELFLRPSHIEYLPMCAYHMAYSVNVCTM